MRSLSKLGSRLARVWRSFSGAPSATHRTTFHHLRVESLEARDVPAITIQLDYSFDTSGFFNNQAARDTLAAVATELGNRLNTHLDAITPSGSNTWTASFDHPSINNAEVTISNQTIAADTIKVFVGGRDLDGNAIGLATPVDQDPDGTTAWQDTVNHRGHTGFSPWGGSIAFDTLTNWHFGLATGPASNEFDFYTVSLHEMGHMLGFGLSTEWSNLRIGNFFYGANSAALYGAPVPLQPGGGHWAENLTFGGQFVNLDPGGPPGERVNFSELDYAALRDLGWETVPATPPAVKVVVVGTTTFSLDSLGNLYRQPSGGSPVLLSSNIHQMGSITGQFFALQYNGTLFKYNAATLALDVSVSSGIINIGPGQGRFFALGNDGVVRKYNAGTGVFDLTTLTNITQIGNGQGQLFALNTGGAMARPVCSTRS
jgi:hypothetical protein